VTSEKFYTFIIMGIHGECLLFFLMLQYNLINNSVNFMYVNFALYIVFGRHIFIIYIFLYLPVW